MRDVSFERLQIGDCLIAKWELDSLKIKKLHFEIAQTKQLLSQDRQRLKEVKEKSKKRFIVPFIGQSAFVFYNDAIKMSEEKITRLTRKLSKLNLRYNGFLVGTSIFNKL